MRLEYDQHFFRPWVVHSGGIAEQIAVALNTRGKRGVQNKEGKEAAIIALLADLFYRHTVAVSHDRNHYSRWSKVYIPLWFTLANVAYAVGTLIEEGLVIPLPGVHGISSTVLFSSPELLDLFEAGEKPLIQNKELVQLRNKIGRKQIPVEYTDNAFTKQRRWELEELNEFGTGFNLSYAPYIKLQTQLIQHPLYKHSPLYKTDSLKSTGTIDYGAILCPLSNSMHCVFSGDFNHGGRVYTSAGPQNIRRDERKTITVDGSDTAEPDFKAHHLRMLYAMVGIQYDGEGYIEVCEELGGGENLRPVVKHAFTTGINAQKSDYGCGFYGQLIKDSKSSNQQKREDAQLKWDLLKEYELDADTILKAIETVHAPISHYLASGIGSELQRVDGQIILEALLGLKDDGILGCGVHDSVVVPEQHLTKTVDLMHEAYSRNMNGFTAIIDIGG